MQTRLIYFPNKLGQRLNGVQYTPKILQEYVNKPFFEVDCNNSEATRKANLFENLQKLYYVNASMTEGFRINIGGDHSMSIATVADSLNRVQTPEQLKVLWFDAHPDMNTYESSITKNYHGMPLAFLSGLCKEPAFSFIKQKLLLKNLMYIGIRDIDPFEQKVIDQYKINTLTVSDINKRPFSAIQKLREFIGNDSVHISFDVDCIDPKFIPCTGTAVSNGINIPVLSCILHSLKYHNIVNMDITELNFEACNTVKEQETSKENMWRLFENYLRRC